MRTLIIQLTVENKFQNWTRHEEVLVILSRCVS